jgi:hypothetical protein
MGLSLRRSIEEGVMDLSTTTRGNVSTDLSHWSASGNAAGVALTVPAADTIHLVRMYNVHACPNTTYYAYKPTQYMTHRAQGGVMFRVYDLDPAKVHIFLLNPAKPSLIRNQIIDDQPISDADKERVRQYVDRRLRENVFEDPHDCDYRVYVYPAEGNIELPRTPRLKGRAQNQRYVRLADLRMAREFVQPIEGY